MFFFSFDARYVRVGRVREAEALIGRGLEDAEAALRVVRQLRFRSGRTLLVGAACGREFEVAAPLVALFLQRRNKDKPKTIDNQEASRLNLHQAPDRQPTARKRQKKKRNLVPGEDQPGAVERARLVAGRDVGLAPALDHRRTAQVQQPDGAGLQSRPVDAVPLQVDRQRRHVHVESVTVPKPSSPNLFVCFFVCWLVCFSIGFDQVLPQVAPTGSCPVFFLVLNVSSKLEVLY